MMTDTAILDGLPIGFCVTDREGHITYYNDAAAQIWGWRPVPGSMWSQAFEMSECDAAPMAGSETPPRATIRQHGYVRRACAVAGQRDGMGVRFTLTPTEIRDQAGQIIGAVNVVSEAREVSPAESWLSAIVASSDDAIIGKTLDGIITCWNAGAQRMFGYTAAEMIGQSITKIIPPELRHQEQYIQAELRKGKYLTPFETVRLVKDGRRVALALTVSPVYDSSGSIIGVANLARDITARKESENIQKLLLQKLNHRVKNTLATVQAIGRQSLVHARNERDFIDSFTRRVQALAKAHALLTDSWMRGAYLSELVEQQALIGGAGEGCVRYSGPAVQLDPARTIHLGLMLHELASNARRHGALSTPNGHVNVTWEVRSESGRLLVLEWQESGGPEVTSPAQTGFGTRLIHQTAHNYGGEARIDFRADGVACRIELPLQDKPDAAIDLRTPPEAAVSLLPPPAQSAVLKGKRVLVVEDEPLVALDICAFLTAAGCEVVGPSGNVPEAQRLAEQADLDVALLDFNLEGTFSVEVAQSLSRRNIPFAFVTGYSRTALPPAFRECLMLAKPFVCDQLITVVETLVYVSKPSAGVVRLRRDRGHEPGAAVA